MNKKAFHTLEFDKILSRLTDCAVSPLGKKLCSELEPSHDIAAIRRALSETTDALSRIRMKGTPSFLGLKDVRESLKRLEIGGTLSIPELLAIHSLLTLASRAIDYGFREGDSEVPDDSLDRFYRQLDPVSPLARELGRCILSEEEISDNASPGLARVRGSIRKINDGIRGRLNAILNAHRNYLQDAVITMRGGSYCLPVKAEYKSLVSGIVHDQSGSGSTLFIEPMDIIQMNNELRELELQEKKEIELVLIALSSQTLPYTEVLQADQKILAHLDFVFAKAALSRQMKGSEPRMNQKGYLHIKDARHPLLDPDKVVPVHIYLGRDFDQLIITGPNTGGKTVSLKTVGLFTLMGQSGLHIPAFEGSELAVFEDVFADIGDEQSIEQNLSTFSAHMTNIISILNQADSRSLCLFDELCAGTDPTEGAALAISILTFLHNMKCRTMATTHYSEIKVYALTTDGVENACCEFSLQTLSPTYRLLIGIPGKSNAFAISSKLGLPDYIIEEARTHLESNDETFEDLLAHLEEDKVTIEKERTEISAYKSEISQLKDRLAQKEEKLEERRDKILRQANEEARRILQEAKDTADETIRNVNRLASMSGVNKELEAERTRVREKLNKTDSKLAVKPKGPSRTLSPKALHIGDGVHVLSLNLDGTVSTLPNAKGDLYVQMGILRSLVNIRDLELSEEAALKDLPAGGRNKTGSGKIKMSKSFSVSPEVNLIGKTTDEAIPELEKYLDDAYLAHLPQVRVVHGRGTGALRAAVHKRLKKLNYVKEFRLGDFGEGDTGVTIVTFQ